MIVRVLGSAAGGGVPQWNCACANCTAARRGEQPRRTESCVAIGSAGRWLLLNCSPDIASQIEAFAPLQPQSTRGTPIAGMLFTDANVDHVGGLAVLRQTGMHRFVLRSTSIVREIATAQPAFAPFASPPHHWIDVAANAFCEPVDTGDLVGHALDVRPIPVSGSTPGYAGRLHIPGAVVAYEIRDRQSGRTLLFAPVFAAIDDELRAAVERADLAFLDGSFYSDDELQRAQLMDKTASHLGHQPVGGEDGTLAQLREAAEKIVFTHLNNSNPMLDPSSEAAQRVRSFGAQIAHDGMERML
ncbi:MAG TPA: MBL fold metallo-hydrolase [Candidatus Baltobacteraceae bacterium]|nr:MBL fold metallo-hydrolase [Candidatus Baltobacteraceae bacterium]